MGKIISETLAGPDDPIYREPARSYSPHWARGFQSPPVPGARLAPDGQTKDPARDPGGAAGADRS
jgi:hypothetical protein